MQGEKKGLTTAKLTKDYLSNNEIPQLFECLMTGLMYHRPSDHLTYLEDCLKSIRKHGVNGLRWDMFLEARKSPLPPIESTPKEDYRPKPLPDIVNYQLHMLADASVIIVIAGPGVDKRSICKRLCASFPNYIDIEMGNLLRDRALSEAHNSDSKWKSVQETIDNGDLASTDFVTETLINELNKHSDKKHFIIEGYPRTNEQQEAFERHIGLDRLKFVLVIDCEENLCSQKLEERDPIDGWNDHSKDAITNRIGNYQTNTLVVIRYLDQHKKLRLIDGDREEALVMKDIHELFITELNEPIVPHPPSAPKERRSPSVERQVSNIMSPRSRMATEIMRLMDVSPEEDRNQELPLFKLLLLLGGPGSGKSEVAAQVCSQHESWVHLDVNQMLRSAAMDTETPDSDLATCDDNPAFVENWKININALKNSFKSIPDGTEVVILEGFPKDSEQLNIFNIEIGRSDCVILLDSEEDVMHARMAMQYPHTEEVKDDESNNDLRIVYFKDNGLPLCRYYDERSKLSIISSDRDLVEVVSDFEKIAIEKLKLVSEEVVADEIDATERTDQVLDDEATTAAAIKIQASIRGHLTRKKMSKQSAEAQDNSVMINDVENAAEDTERNDEDNELKNEDNVEPLIDILEAEDVVEETINEQENQEEVEDTEEKNQNESEPLAEEPVEEVIISVEVAPLGDKGVRTNSQLELRNANLILLLGGPGSGKKSLGSYIVSKFAISFVHADQIVNDAIESGSEDAEELHKYLANEDFDETTIFALIRKSLFEHLSVSKVLCLAGFPKTVEQYHRFNDDVCPISGTILLDVDEEILKSRLSDPDQPSNYVEQIEAYKNNSPALIEELRSRDLISTVDATQDLDQVTQQVSDIIENFSFMKSEE